MNKIHCGIYIWQTHRFLTSKTSSLFLQISRQEMEKKKRQQKICFNYISILREAHPKSIFFCLSVLQSHLIWWKNTQFYFILYFSFENWKFRQFVSFLLATESFFTCLKARYTSKKKDTKYFLFKVGFLLVFRPNRVSFHSLISAIKHSQKLCRIKFNEQCEISFILIKKFCFDCSAAVALWISLITSFIKMWILRTAI